MQCLKQKKESMAVTSIISVLDILYVECNKYMSKILDSTGDHGDKTRMSLGLSPAEKGQQNN